MHPQKGSWGTLGIILAIVGTGMVIYQMVTTRYHFLPPIQHLNTHLGLALFLVLASALKPTEKLWPLVFLILGLIATVYVQIFAEALMWRTGYPFPPVVDLVMSVILIVVLVEATRQSFGVTLPLVIIAFILYNFFGYLIPPPLGTGRFIATEIISRLGLGGLGEMGIYGSILRISANEIFLFVVFGSLLGTTGATGFFIQIGRWLGSRVVSGPAMTAVVSSALVGTVTGSVTANIATVGPFTIPLMKKAGYRPEQAGAMEAAASTGGQIMPPIMGTAAFVLADFTGITYWDVVVMAVFPAILYFFSVGLYAQFQAMKMKLAPQTQKVDRREMLLTAPLFVLPLALLVVLLGMRYSPAFSISLTLPVLIALSLIRKTTRPSLKKLVSGLTEGATLGGQVAVSCAALGIVVTVLSFTGLGLRIPHAVEAASGGYTLVALALTMVAAIILGMGMPTVAVYILVAVGAIPALIRMGVDLLPAHMFAFYFGIISMVTPPVAIGALVASKLAGSAYIKTAWEATKAAAGGFIVPFLFVWCPALLLLKLQDPVSVAAAFVGGSLSLVIVEAVLCGHYLTPLGHLERAAFVVLGLVIIVSLATKIYPMTGAGVILFVLATIWQSRKRRRLKFALAAVSDS